MIRVCALMSMENLHRRLTNSSICCFRIEKLDFNDIDMEKNKKHGNLKKCETILRFVKRYGRLLSKIIDGEF